MPHTYISTIYDISPAVNNTTLVNHGLIEGLIIIHLFMLNNLMSIVNSTNLLTWVLLKLLPNIENLEWLFQIYTSNKYKIIFTKNIVCIMNIIYYISHSSILICWVFQIKHMPHVPCALLNMLLMGFEEAPKEVSQHYHNPTIT